MKYVKYAVVLLSGCILTEVFRSQLGVSGVWIGRILTGVSLVFMMVKNEK